MLLGNTVVRLVPCSGAANLQCVGNIVSARHKKSRQDEMRYVCTESLENIKEKKIHYDSTTREKP